MLGLSFDMTPTPLILVGQFETFGLSIKSFREPLKKSVQDVMAKSIQANFAAGGRPTWEPLTEDTIRQKSAKGQSSQPLVATGKLQRVAGQLNVWDINGDSAVVSDLPGAEYGFIHNEGSPPNLPQREFLNIQDDDMDNIQNIFADWVTERAIAAGLFGSVF